MSLPLPIEKLHMLMRCLPDSPFKSRLAEEIVAYGQACRAAALEGAAQAIEDANARRVVYLPDAIEIIRSLK